MKAEYQKREMSSQEIEQHLTISLYIKSQGIATILCNLLEIRE